MTATAWAEARWIARESGTALDRTEVTLAEALGFALAAPLVALAPLPAYDAAAMDGYAVAGCGPWRITGRVLAGDPTPREHLSPGFAFRDRDRRHRPQCRRGGAPLRMEGRGDRASSAVGSRGPSVTTGRRHAPTDQASRTVRVDEVGTSARQTAAWVGGSWLVTAVARVL